MQGARLCVQVARLHRTCIRILIHVSRYKNKKTPQAVPFVFGADYGARFSAEKPRAGKLSTGHFSGPAKIFCPRALNPASRKQVSASVARCSFVSASRSFVSHLHTASHPTLSITKK